MFFGARSDLEIFQLDAAQADAAGAPHEVALEEVVAYLDSAAQTGAVWVSRPDRRGLP